ncbi:MAG: hypothetical protein UC662_12780 [Paraprevotella clara]|nr:hypothetical protein [Paraprevotella clara]
MSKYKVKIYYSTFCEVEVEADSPEEAIDKSYGISGAMKYKDQLVKNFRKCDDEDVELLGDDATNEFEANRSTK